MDGQKNIKLFIFIYTLLLEL